MGTHPIEELMRTTMENIRSMVDVNVIVGDPVETPDGSVIIPISRIVFGFAAGGSDFEVAETNGEEKRKTEDSKFPFGGGSGAGVSLQPVAFLIVGGGQVRLLPVDDKAVIGRIIEMAPQLVEQIQGMLSKQGNKSSQQGTANSCPQ